MVIMVFQSEDPFIDRLLMHLRDEFPWLTSIMYFINPKQNDDLSDLSAVHYSGQPYITEEMPARENGVPPLQFKIGPKSFFQTNSLQASVLYSVAAEFADLKGSETVYDLYSGTGTIAIFIASGCKKVVGLEYIDAAIRDAEENALVNHITNAHFIAGDIAKTFDHELISLHGAPDLIITDPPRNGMHDKVIRKILETNAPKVVYISCNPATQARDIALLGEQYDVVRVQPVDMFPQTQHVENVVLLARKN
jgi:23S rRNA (uracil1939-C5)-methyltransferase